MRISRPKVATTVCDCKNIADGPPLRVFSKHNSVNSETNLHLSKSFGTKHRIE